MKYNKYSVYLLVHFNYNQNVPNSHHGYIAYYERQVIPNKHVVQRTNKSWIWEQTKINIWYKNTANHIRLTLFAE